MSLHKISLLTFFCLLNSSFCNYNNNVNNSIISVKMDNDNYVDPEMMEMFTSVARNFLEYCVTGGDVKIRVKRQGGGAGKFTEAAKMPQVKIMRIMLQLFKNLWSTEYIGGVHPLHPEVPKKFVAMFKQYIIEFFFPDVGDDIETKKKKKG